MSEGAFGYMQDFFVSGDSPLSSRNFTKKASDAGNKIGLLFLLLTVFQLTVSFIYEIVVLVAGLFTEKAELLLSPTALQFVIYLVSFSITVFIARTFIELRQTRWYEDADKSPVSLMLSSQRVAPLDFAGAVLICLGAGMLGNIVSSLFSIVFDAVGLPVPDVAFEMPSSVPGIVLYFISVAFLPPLFEEILCRGFIYNLTKEYGPFVCGLVSGVTFALFHNNLAQYSIAFFMGFTMGYMLCKFKNIWICIVAHFINNLCVCVIELLLVLGAIPEAMADTVTLVYIAVFLGLGLFSLIIMGALSRLSAQRVLLSYSPSKKIFLSPGYIAFFAVSVALAIFTLFQGVLL